MLQYQNLKEVDQFHRKVVDVGVIHYLPNIMTWNPETTNFRFFLVSFTKSEFLNFPQPQIFNNHPNLESEDKNRDKMFFLKTFTAFITSVHILGDLHLNFGCPSSSVKHNMGAKRLSKCIIDLITLVKHLDCYKLYLGYAWKNDFIYTFAWVFCKSFGDNLICKISEGQ